MNINELQAICKKLTGVTEDIKWENHLCFCIGGKMFLVLGLDEVPTTASFKVSKEEFEEIFSREGFKPAPYMARNKWVHTNDINNLSPEEWEYYIKESYKLVSSKLTVKLRRELGLI